MKNGKTAGGTKKILIGSGFLLEALIVFAAAFFYSHWTAYKIAARHLDGWTVIPAIPGAPALICFGIALFRAVKGRNRERHILFMIVFLILIAGCVYACVQSGNAMCPACCTVKDEWYKALYRYFNGREYVP